MKRIASTTVPVVRGPKRTMVACPKCKTSMRSDNLKAHLLQHNEKVKCKFCKKSIRSDLLLKHETLCQTSVDESLCDRRTGVSQLYSGNVIMNRLFRDFSVV